MDTVVQIPGVQTHRQKEHNENLPKNFCKNKKQTGNMSKDLLPVCFSFCETVKKFVQFYCHLLKIAEKRIE